MSSVKNKISIGLGNEKTITLTLNLEISVQTNKSSVSNENEMKNLVENLNLNSPTIDNEDLSSINLPGQSQCFEYNDEGYGQGLEIVDSEENV